MTDQTSNPDLDDLDDREPCGESGCICHCGQGHVCSCDCWRCGECQQTADHCQCDDEDDGDDLCNGCGTDLTETDGNTFDMADGGFVQLCPPCETRWNRPDERDNQDEED